MHPCNEYQLIWQQTSEKGPACKALGEQSRVALGLAHKEVQLLVHDLLLARIGHHLLLVLHHPLRLAPELHRLHPPQP